MNVNSQMTITGSQIGRRHFIGGSDARIIMGQDEKALIRLWQEKRGEVGPEDLSTSRDGGAAGREKPGFGSIRDIKITDLSCATLACGVASLLRHRFREGNRFQPAPTHDESFQRRPARLPDALFRNRQQLRGPKMRPLRAPSESCLATLGRLDTGRKSFQQFLLTAFRSPPINNFC